MADDNTTLTDNGATATIDEAAARQERADAAAAEEMLVGKFKTQDDLIAAYKELERKLSAPAAEAEDTVAADGEDTVATPEGEDTVAAEDGEAEDFVYSEQVDAALKAVEMDPQALASEWSENGELSEGTYEKLAKAGYPKDMVDSYISGFKAQQAQAEGITLEQIKAIKDVAGGEKGFEAVASYIAMNYSPEQIDAYNEAIGSGDVLKATEAVKAAHEAYTKSVGVEGEIIGGKAAPAAEGYKHEGEMIADMKNPLYKKMTAEGAAFRAEVDRKIMAMRPGAMMTR